jgi:E3 ubiquitin-protein ligase DMA1/2
LPLLVFPSSPLGLQTAFHHCVQPVRQLLPRHPTTPNVMMTRNRHNSASQTASIFSVPRLAPTEHADHPAIPTSSTHAKDRSEYGAGNSTQGQLPTIRFIPYQDPRASRPSLVFPAVSRILPSCDSVLRVGRYSERDNVPDTMPHGPSAAPVGFKSKVVSRRHCEFWCTNSQWYIKDVKSSSGTFLNHIRLSQPGVESRPWPVNDGDVVQLGIDFKGGDEQMYRCVKIRLECNRGWQKALNTFK